MFLLVSFSLLSTFFSKFIFFPLTSPPLSQGSQRLIFSFGWVICGYFSSEKQRWKGSERKAIHHLCVKTVKNERKFSLVRLWGHSHGHVFTLLHTWLGQKGSNPTHFILVIFKSQITTCTFPAKPQLCEISLFNWWYHEWLCQLCVAFMFRCLLDVIYILDVLFGLSIWCEV